MFYFLTMVIGGNNVGKPNLSHIVSGNITKCKKMYILSDLVLRKLLSEKEYHLYKHKQKYRLYMYEHVHCSIVCNSKTGNKTKCPSTGN